METVYRDYSPKGVKFYYIYKALAHPETNGYVQPFTQEERLLHVKEAQRTLGSEFNWLCDTIKNDLKHSLGNAPNSEYLIDPEGNVLKKRSWSDPDQLRKDLAEILGAVKNPTRVADLNLKTEPPPKVAASGIVKKLPRSRSMQALVVEPKLADNKQPFYAKLRAEAGSDLLKDGKGKLYLGFHLDPIYHVHWNNLTKPIHVEISSAGGIVVSPSELDGPKLKEPADIDPREFLVEVELGKNREPIKIEVRYFACNDEEGWCRPVSQEYTVRFETDRDAGWVSQRRGGNTAGRRPPAGAGRQFRQGDFQMGRIASVNVEKRKLSIRTRNGKQQEFQIGKDVILMHNMRRAKLTDFKRGDMVRFEISKEKNRKENLPAIKRMMGRSAR